MDSKDSNLKADEITVGFHPDGYRIDKSAAPMERYTKWAIDKNGEWKDPEPVCFHSMPETGWSECNPFDWEDGQEV